MADVVDDYQDEHRRAGQRRARRAKLYRVTVTVTLAAGRHPAQLAPRELAWGR